MTYTKRDIVRRVAEAKGQPMIKWSLGLMQ